ncbi:hypothetical protein F4801DRAFT_253871 [Xylaria longipes]|nr:hypothetical protein F4801DRAFT_253871 [Xylaria longipes]RYC56220.1 hypothetical protein CHU98_g9989 [Xylaria longipes]
MKSPQQILTIALALSPLAAAWSHWLPDLDSLVVRQDDGSSSQDDQPTKTPTPQPSASSGAAKETGSSEPSQSGKADASMTGTSKGGHKTSGSSSPKHTTFNVLDPAGGVSMIEPPVTAAMTLYRIDNTEPITWKWNYTSLQGKPSAIDVLISCSKVTSTWTLTQNMTFAPTATFTWDSNKFQQEQIGNQLPVEKYTLLIHDSETSFTDTPDPGYLAPYAGFQFGLYTAKPYSNLNSWKCLTCSAAPGGPLDRQVLGFALTMTLLTVLSFTWYVTGIAALV